MKKATLFLIGVAALCFEGIGQQKKPVAKPKPSVVTPSPLAASKLFAVARPTKKEILIRWAPADEMTWEAGNKYGYIIEKYVITQNGQLQKNISLPTSKKLIKPRPIENWDSLANANDNAAVMAQALYGEDFEVEAKGGDNGVTSIINQTEVKKQRFITAMYAADQSFITAEFGALAFTDSNVKANEKYFYRIYSAVPKTVRKIDTALIYTGLMDYKPLPQPAEVFAEFGDKMVMLKWDYDKNKEHYTSYIIERSADNGKSFTALSDKPFSNLMENKNENIPASIYFMDSLPDNIQEFQYRVAGVSLFGDTGPYSNISKGKGKYSLIFTPAITGVDMQDNGQYLLNWEIEDSAALLVREFQINQAETIDGPFLPVVKNLAPDVRVSKINNLEATNYFTVTAISVEGEQKSSAPFLLQPEDSIPPAIPADFQASIDSAGKVTLTWKANTEKDLAGYRVFRTNLVNNELMPITDSVWLENTFIDSVNLKSLNRKIYYTIRAVDRRANESPYAQLIQLTKPDIIPPSSPVMAGYEIKEEGIKIMWVNSSSEDVASHTIYRKENSANNAQWELVGVVKEKTSNELLDKKCEEGHTYSYTVIATDSAMLESTPVLPLTVTMVEKRVKKAFKQMEANVDRDNRIIVLNWQALPVNKKIKYYELYRGEGKKAINLYQQLSPAIVTFTDKQLQVNTIYKYGLRAVYEDGKNSDFIIQNVTY
jgi:uncharacterized protein